MRAHLLALALTCLALAGCTGGSDEAPAPAAAAASTSAAPAPPPPPPAVHMGVCEATTGITYGVPGLGANGEPAVCRFAEALPGDLSAFQGAVVEAVWIPAATVTGAQLLIQSDSCWRGMGLGADGSVQQNMCDEGNVQGTAGPLRLDLDAAALQRRGNDNLTAMALAHGATAGQPFTIYVTLFEGIPPAGFTAIPA